MRSSLRVAVLTFLAAIAVASALYWLGRAVPIVQRNLHACIAVVFFYAPVVAGRLSRRSFDFRDAGLRLDPIPLNAAVLAVAIALTFPLFVLAFFGFYDIACGERVDWLGRVASRFCPGPGWSWAGDSAWRSFHLRWPPELALLALNQVLVIALPEELFFRGYLLQRLEERWPSRHRLGGAAVGPALLASSALFALGHFLVDFNPQRLAVFFPALVFGWMRARTGSIAPGTAYHALCNLLADVLHTSAF